MKRWFLLLTALLLVGCTTGSMGVTKARLPYDTWRLGFSAPPYMSVWVETADVEDVTGRIFHRAGSGTVSMGYIGDPAEWQGPQTWGAGKYVTGADLPKRIYVRWQSLVELQTYRAILEIPEEARKLMLTRAESRVVPGSVDYRKAIAIGLAPGGVVRVRVTGPVGQRKGPDLGQYGRRYVTLPAKAKAYVDQHPIPCDSWKCPGTL